MIDLGKILIPLQTPFGDDFQVCYNRVQRLAEQVNELQNRKEP